MNQEETIFAEALDRTSAQARSAFLDQACGADADLRSGVDALLLAHERAEGVLESPPAGLEPIDDRAESGGQTPSPSEQAGSLVGAYKLLEQIGEGGMGAVFLAEQSRPMRRRVALKIIKPGLDTKQVIARFEAERQALALMDHPNIAKVLDAGATDAGRPYFVMELVRGIPLTQYCDQHQLSTAERLGLFVQVCRAVQHAHTKGIIHRDLKPTNVLVTLNDGKPVPKIIDFGIAKAVVGEQLTDKTLFTNFAQMIGTPLYMSPEQAEMSALMDVDTRSDVYSLGVLLYELLTGTTPFDKQRLAKAAYDEVRRILREEEPQKPSTRLSTMLGETLTAVSAQRHTDGKRLGQLVRGELDWIVMRALEKDRTRRYETAVGLAKDVGRYLSDQPVEACPPSRLYRFRKFARRNKAALATTAMIVAVLILATVVSTWQAVRATRAERQVARERDQVQAENRRADEQAAIAQAVNDFLGEMLSAADPHRLLGDKVTVLQATREALKRLDEGALKDKPLTESAVRNTIGNTLRALSRYDEAEPALGGRLELRRKSLPVGHPDVAASLNNLAQLLNNQGKLGEADVLSAEALAIHRKALPGGHLKIAGSLSTRASLLQRQGKLAEAEPLYREALEICRGALPSGHPSIAVSLNSLATLLRDQDKDSDAELLIREALEINRKSLPAGHPSTAALLFNLGWLLKDQDKLAEAELLIREALEIIRKALPAGHPNIATSLMGLGWVLHDQGKLAEIEPLFREALEIHRKALPPGHPAIAAGLNSLGLVLKDLGKLDEAESLFREALEIHRKGLPQPPGNWDIANVLNSLGWLLKDQGELAEAELLIREALEFHRKSLPPGHPRIGASLHTVGWLLRDLGKLDEAESLFREALDIHRTKLGPRAQPTTQTAAALASVLSALHREAEADAVRRQYELASPTTTPTTPATGPASP